MAQDSALPPKESATSWSAKQYVAFEDERTRPARDLLAQVPLETVSRAIDLGCGPGNSTELLVARYGARGVSGMDSDANMLEAARKRLNIPRPVAYERAQELVSAADTWLATPA